MRLNRAMLRSLAVLAALVALAVVPWRGDVGMPAVLEAGGIAGILVLAWINGLMAVLRYKAGFAVHRAEAAAPAAALEISAQTVSAEHPKRVLEAIESAERVLFVAASAGRREKLAEVLGEHGITAKRQDSWADFIAARNRYGLTAGNLDTFPADGDIHGYRAGAPAGHIRGRCRQVAAAGLGVGW